MPDDGDTSHAPSGPGATGKRPRLTLHRLVTGALDVAHHRGADRMTMKDVALHLGVGTMSIYYYVPDKAALLTQMVGELYARVTVPSPADPWEDRLRALLSQVYGGFVTVPGLEPMTQFDEPALSHYARVADATLSALADSGIPRDDAIRAALVLTGYAANRGAATARRVHAYRTMPEARETLVARLSESPHPLISDVAAEAAGIPHEEVFAFGLDMLLDGVRARATSPGAG